MSGVDSRIIGLPDSETKASTTVPATKAGNGVLISEFDIYTDPGDWRFFGFALGIIVVVLGTAGNGLTVWAYKNNRNLQTSFNVLIANLCCVELIFSLIIIPLQLPGYIMQAPPYPKELCAVIGYLYYSSMGASLQNLVAIAVNRYVGIVNTKRYQRMFTGSKLRLWVASIWLISPILHLPLVIGGTIQWAPNSLRCAMAPSGNQGIRIYNTVLNVFYQAGGLIVLIALYSSIIKKVKEVQKKLKIHKKASFRRTVRSKPSVDSKQEPHTPATTSGDEGIDDYRPSSIISGGFHFRPAKDAKREFPSDSGHGSDHDIISHKSKRISGHTNSQASCITVSDEPSPTPNKRRTSLWQVLFRTKARQEMGPKEDDEAAHAIELTTDEESRKEATIGPADPIQHVTIVLRDMDNEKKDMRRKKSLSAPTLPSLDEIMASSRKSSAVAQNIPERVTEVNEAASTETSPRLTRAFTVGSKYKKNMQNGKSSIRLTAEQVNLLTTRNLSNNLSASDKAFCTSMPTLAPQNGPETPPHTRFGTIAKKIKDQKSKKRKTRSQRSRQRTKALRRRHARERQLVYSSLSICIAFAVCILPTSLLHVTQTLFKFQVSAAVVLIVGCISWLHSVVNPFIYGYMNHLYRKEYGHIAKEFEKKLSACFK